MVIPVRNREQTVAVAVRSALSQETDFPFNILVGIPLYYEIARLIQGA